MKLYEKRRYEQAARLIEDTRFDGERGAQAQLMLGMIYLRNADLHETFARTAAAAQLDYLDKLSKAGGEGRSRYARLYLAEAMLARGNAREAARQFERARADSALELRYRALASVGLGAALWALGDAERSRKLWGSAGDEFEVRLARAAAQGRAGVLDAKALHRVIEEARGTKDLSPRARRYLVEICLAAGVPEQALAVVRGADLGTASYVERFKATEGTTKTIAFYDLALLTDLAQLYRELARRRL
jgi:tetratricopeptide (TPR) repeat protein